MPIYHFYELNHALLSPFRAMADFAKMAFSNPLNPLTHTPLGRSMAATAEVFERTTRRYGKPEWEIDTVEVDGRAEDVRIQTVWSRPFCNLIHFEKASLDHTRRDPKLLLVAPMSGHYATLLRGTVEGLLPTHDVYVTDWVDARLVPAVEGRFDLDDYVDYIIAMLHALGGNTHVMAVCQPSVPVLSAVAVMEAAGDRYAPLSMTLMGGPIDTRVNPTAVNALASKRDLNWFKSNVTMKVPLPHPGFMRDVYPGFLQLSGFMGMNIDRHLSAHQEFFNHLIEGDGDSAEKHRDFYDEYLAVMDLTAEFYLQTVDTVFMRHLLPKGEMVHRGALVDTKAIRNVALMTVEGEKDDITGVGQTEAAHTLCSNIPDEMRVHYVQEGVGHYGVFNGGRFRKEIVPRVTAFIDAAERRAVPASPARRVADQAARLIGKVVGKKADGDKVEAVKAEPAKVKPVKAEVVKAEAAKVEVAKADDLTRIAGIGPKIAAQLAELGFTTFARIAAMSEAEVALVEEQFSVKGRVARDRWIEQARELLAAPAAS